MKIFLYKQELLFCQGDGYFWPHCCMNKYTYHIDHFTPQHTAFEQSAACLSVFLELLPGSIPLMLASHCPELDTRWPHEYGILNFARRWPRTWSPANQQPKQLRCLQKVTRWQPNHTRRQHEDVIFYQVTYPQDTRRLHDSYTTSY